MKINIFFAIKILVIVSIFSSCSYDYKSEKIYSYKKIEKIFLNIASLEIKNENLNRKKNISTVTNKINKKLLHNFEEWSLQKFQIDGSSNQAYINIENMESILVEKNSKKKSNFSFLEKKKKTYNIKFNFDISFIKNDLSKKKLNISTNIDLVLFDNYSVIKNNEAMSFVINKLIKLIDNKVNKELNKEIFREFIIIKN